MIIYGASGHAKVIIDIIQSIEESIDFILDDDKSKIKLLEFPIDHEYNDSMKGQKLVVAIGDNSIRKYVVEKTENRFINALIHDTATISKQSKIGIGSVVMPHAVINSSVVIGQHCIINTSSIIEHDSKISDFVHISPGAIITGNVKIGEGTQVGAGATIIPGVEIGKWVTIGAGTVVLEDVPDYAVVVGNPGKIIKFNKSYNE